MPISISSSPMVKVGLPAMGTVQGESATPIVRVFASAFCAAATTSSSEPPLSAQAPAHLKAKIMPATPRRRPASSGGAEATSSLTNTVRTSMSSKSAISAAMSKFNTSPP